MQTTAPITNVTLTPQSPASALAGAWAASLPHTICEGRFRIEAAAFEALRPQLIRAYRTHLQGISREDASEFHERLAHYERTCFGAVVRDEGEPFEIVGSLLVESTEPGTLYIRWMNLLPRAQANGIPESLLRHLLRFARSAGFRRLEADIQFQNSHFLKVLSGRGFTVAGIQLSERWGSTVRLSRSIAPSSGSIPSRKEEQHHEEESQEVCSVHSLKNDDLERQDLPEWLDAFISDLFHKWFQDLEFFRRIENGDVTLQEILIYLEGLRRLLRSTPLHLKLAEDRAQRMNIPHIFNFLREKQVEEAGHDEWAKLDIDSLAERAKVSPEQLERLPLPGIDRLIAVIFELAATDLSSYFAYIFMTEYSMLVVGPRCLDALQNYLHIPNKGISVIQNHIQLDKGHVEDDRQIIRSLIHPSERQKVLNSLVRIDYVFRNWITEIRHDEIG